jgi:hypothetical protein
LEKIRKIDFSPPLGIVYDSNIGFHQFLTKSILPDLVDFPAGTLSVERPAGGPGTVLLAAASKVAKN